MITETKIGYKSKSKQFFIIGLNISNSGSDSPKPLLPKPGKLTPF